MYNEVFFRGFRAKKSHNQPHINNNVRSIWFLELSLPLFQRNTQENEDSSNEIITWPT